MHSSNGWKASKYVQPNRPFIFKRLNFFTRSVRAQTQKKQRLRYRDYRLLRLEAVTTGQLTTAPGNVAEFGAMKGLSAHLEECEVWEWWAGHMGFTNGGR